MKRIILSLMLIVGTLGAIGFGATGAFFSDTETSTANVFTAGDVDLKIDNESYYNGLFNKGTSWDKADLDDTSYKFFDFNDLKPGDYGEDTISIHVDTNDAYLCADVTLTSNNENTCNEPEALDDLTCGAPEDTVGAGQGELASLVKFMWWADDGDNVLETDENVISEGTLDDLTLGEPYPLTLADADTNIWNELAEGGPVAGDTTYYIGKAWCFGDMTIAELPQDGENDAMSPGDDNNDNDVAGEPEDGGFTCDGAFLNNGSQTDSLTADISFAAIQARHNDSFRCDRPEPRSTRLTLVKNVVNDDLGAALPSAWTLMADGPSDISGTTGSGAVTNAEVLPGTYTLSETGGVIGYDASEFSCVKNGGSPVLGNSVTLLEGDVVVCTITNNDREPLACDAQRTYADTIVSFDQGVKKNNTPVDANRSDPSVALGAPQSLGTPFDNPAPVGQFFSLGFDEGGNPGDGTPNEGGWVILSFNDNYIIDGPGNDIRAWEVTGGQSYPVEKLKVEVSQDGTTWYTANPALLRDEEADMSNTPLDWARYVRLTDVSTRSEFEPTADGYDLDAVSALNCAFVPAKV